VIELDSQQIEKKLFLFAYLRREDVFEKEICYSCINGETKKDKSLCSCNKQIHYVIPDFKVYEKYLTGQIVTEINYYLDPYTRYIYVLNQRNEILRVFDMDQLERKGFENYDTFDISVNYHISNNIIVSYLYFHFKLLNKTIEPFFDDDFFELLDIKLHDDILMSDNQERMEKISIIYPWKDYIPNLHKIISKDQKINSIFKEFEQYIEDFDY
jgi:hypothetical protein